MLLKLLKVAVIAIAIQSVRCDTYYRLNTTITPIAYTVTITPYFDTGNEAAFTFDGEVSIQFTSETNINQIKLHSEDLTFSASNITVTTGLTILNLDATNPLEFDEKYTFAHINLQTELQAGVEYNLNIVYRGPIRQDLSGFYRNFYIEKGVKKWLGATQFQATNARKVFPCFDEPHLKAIFTLIIDRPEHYQPSLANTKMQSSVQLSNGYVREIFFPTPRMSTYLVAFLISEFEAAASIVVGSNEFGVYTRPEAKNQSEYAFDFGRRVVQALGDYYGIDYYSVDSNLRLDHVALLDFSGGAMENWGLIKYREALLLFVPEESNPYYKYRIAQIVAHETTHMWFGNLVTCHWWSNTWLNEGFANYFQDYITSLIEPEVGSADILVTGSVYSAYDADDFPDSPPISNENVNSPGEISGHFGTVTYQKAGSIIRMMHHLMGDDAFKLGLNAYLDSKKFQPGYPEDLYEGLQSGVTAYNSFSLYPETDITSVMTSWITQAGHPIVTVSVNREDFTVSLTQLRIFDGKLFLYFGEQSVDVIRFAKGFLNWVVFLSSYATITDLDYNLDVFKARKRFYINSSYESDEIYKIPITYTVGNAPKFNNTKPAFIMHNKTHVFSLDNTTDPLSWVILNIEETGLYRVNYDSQTWNLISTELKGNGRENIHYLNRAKIVNDLFAFLYADVVAFDQLHDVLGFLVDETNYSVWLAAIRGFNKLRTFYLGSDTLGIIDAYALKLMENIINNLGYEVNANDDYAIQRNRMLLLEFICKVGHQGCHDNLLAMYRDFKENGKAIAPSLRSIAYCIGLRYGDGDDYDFLWNRMATTNVANEARLIGEIMGCSSNENKLRSYLISMLLENSPIKKQDLSVPLSSVLSNYTNVPVVLEELDQNVTLWNTIFSSLDSVLSTVASALHTEEEFNNYESWLTSCTQCSEQAVTAARRALANARAKTTWADNHKAYILRSLQNNAFNKSASAAILILSVLLSLLVSR